MKFNFTLIAVCHKKYEIEAKDKDEAETLAIEDFKKNHYKDLDEYETYAKFEA